MTAARARTSGRVSPFELQPTIAGSLIFLRPIEESDFETLFAIASDPGLWEQHPVKNRTDRTVFRSWFADAVTNHALVVVESSTGLLIGTSRFKVPDEPSREVEIGWTFLARDRWGMGYNDELKRLMIDHAFSWAEVITFKVHENNLRSLRAVEKLGAQQVRLEPAWHGVGSSVVFTLSPDVWSARS